MWLWVGLAWARYFALSLPIAAAAAATGEAPVARAGSFPRFRGVLGAAAWPAEAVARLAGAAVATPCAPTPLPSSPFVLDSLFFATPKSKRVSMHAWRYLACAGVLSQNEIKR